MVSLIFSTFMADVSLLITFWLETPLGCWVSSSIAPGLVPKVSVLVVPLLLSPQLIRVKTIPVSSSAFFMRAQMQLMHQKDFGFY